MTLIWHKQSTVEKCDSPLRKASRRLFLCRELACRGDYRRQEPAKAAASLIADEQIETFFATLADTCNVVRSAKEAGFSANWAYRKRKTDAAFRNGWAAAVREGYAKLELVLLERAMEGTPRLVKTAKGTDRVMREYSTALAVALLKRHAETADGASYEPGEEELREIRERILEKLDGLRRRQVADAGEVETKGWSPIEVIRWALARRTDAEPVHLPSYALPQAIAG